MVHRSAGLISTCSRLARASELSEGIDDFGDRWQSSSRDPSVANCVRARAGVYESCAIKIVDDSCWRKIFCSSDSSCFELRFIRCPPRCRSEATDQLSVLSVKVKTPSVAVKLRQLAIAALRPSISSRLNYLARPAKAHQTVLLACPLCDRMSCYCRPDDRQVQRECIAETGAVWCR